MGAYGGSPRGFRERRNSGKILKGTMEDEPIFREQGNKTLLMRGLKHGIKGNLLKGNK